MAILNVNPTRMELTRLKKRYKTALRGHKLLKDKRDEMMRRFIDLIKQNKQLREKVEAELAQALGDFLLARAVMSSEVLEEAIMYPVREARIEAKTQNIMSVNVPVIRYLNKDEETQGGYPYSFPQTSAELDGAITTLSEVLPQLIQLAEIEKTCQMLADEIEKTRRRVNALEYVMIPQLSETIKYITMKLDESDRSSRTRLMKVKEMIQQRTE